MATHTDMIRVEFGGTMTYDPSESIDGKYPNPPYEVTGITLTSEHGEESGISIISDDPHDVLSIENHELVFTQHTLAFDVDWRVLDSNGEWQTGTDQLTVQLDMPGQCGHYRGKSQKFGAGVFHYFKVHDPATLPVAITVKNDQSNLWNGYNVTTGKLVVDGSQLVVGSHLCQVEIQNPGVPAPPPLLMCFQVTVTV